MKIQRLVSTIIAATLVSTGSFSMTVLSAFSPLTQSAKAISCNWSSSRPLPWDVNVRESKTTDSSKIGTKKTGEILNFEAWEDGQAVQDQFVAPRVLLDTKWFKLRGEAGWVASAVVPGYPPSNCVTPPSRLPNTVSAANPFFKLQFNHPTYNPTGPNSSGNCGPASLAMIFHVLGKQPPGLNIQQSIDNASRLMVRASASRSSWAELQRGVTKAGGTPIDISSWAELDQRLSQGQPVVLNGYYGPNWRNQFPGSTGNGAVAHLNAALGKTTDGKYIIGDPMHRGGAVAMTRSQLSAFFTLGGQNGNPWGIAVTGL